MSRQDIFNLPWQHFEIPPISGCECQSNLCPPGTKTKRRVKSLALKIGKATMHEGVFMHSSS